MLSKLSPLLFAFGGALVASCTKSAPERTVLQSSDLQTGEGGTFDRNELVAAALFTDSTGLDAARVQEFLTHTPYKRSSFLETYQSNGIRASDAVMAAATKFRINPIVFLVRLEMAQGLVGEQFYPFPPARVEYVFGCGCVGPGVCDPALAGLDRQIDCFARALRTSLDEIAASGKTSGGWGPGRTSTTVDGETVIPADASTAALYQYMPVVGAGKSGNWLFWNIWQNYVIALGYGGPITDDTVGGGGIGDPCSGDLACYAYEGGTCIRTALTPEGLCSFDCATAPCPPASEGSPTFCARFDDAGQARGYCLVECDPAAPSACRAGYTCLAGQEKYGDPSTRAAVCFNK